MRGLDFDEMRAVADDCWRGSITVQASQQFPAEVFAKNLTFTFRRDTLWFDSSTNQVHLKRTNDKKEKPDTEEQIRRESHSQSRKYSKVRRQQDAGRRYGAGQGKVPAGQDQNCSPVSTQEPCC